MDLVQSNSTQLNLDSVYILDWSENPEKYKS